MLLWSFTYKLLLIIHYLSSCMWQRQEYIQETAYCIIEQVFVIVEECTLIGLLIYMVNMDVSFWVNVPYTSKLKPFFCLPPRVSLYGGSPGLTVTVLCISSFYHRFLVCFTASFCCLSVCFPVFACVCARAHASVIGGGSVNEVVCVRAQVLRRLIVCVCRENIIMNR